jgi:enolase
MVSETQIANIAELIRRKAATVVSVFVMNMGTLAALYATSQRSVRT